MNLRKKKGTRQHRDGFKTYFAGIRNSSPWSPASERFQVPSPVPACESCRIFALAPLSRSGSFVWESLSRFGFGVYHISALGADKLFGWESGFLCCFPDSHHIQLLVLLCRDDYQVSFDIGTYTFHSFYGIELARNFFCTCLAVQVDHIESRFVSGQFDLLFGWFWYVLGILCFDRSMFCCNCVRCI